VERPPRVRCLPDIYEKESIRAAIDDFFAAGHVDEIVVVDNNAAEGTDNEVRATSARLVFEPRQGYGYAIWRASRKPPATS